MILYLTVNRFVLTEFVLRNCLVAYFLAVEYNFVGCRTVEAACSIAAVEAVHNTAVVSCSTAVEAACNIVVVAACNTAVAVAYNMVADFERSIAVEAVSNRSVACSRAEAAACSIVVEVE